MPELSGETQAPEATNTDTDTETAQATDTDTDPWAGIPEQWAWAKNAVESANREAASRRVALRELEDRTKDAKTPEEFAAAMAEVKAAEEKLAVDLARERAARTHKLTDELVEFLTGTNPEEIESQAAKLAALTTGTVVPKYITQPAPAGGVQPSQPVIEQDGKKAWEQYRARNRR